MTLKQIISAALEQLGNTTDAQTQAVWRNKFVQLANEGLMDLGEAMELRRTDDATLTNGEFDVNALPYECMKVLSVSQNGTDYGFSRGSASNMIAVAATGTVQVQYRYLPNEVSSDTDIPGIPPHLHSLIVLYVCAREHSTANVDTQNRYNPLYKMYLEGKERVRKNYGEPESYKITNKGW